MSQPFELTPESARKIVTNLPKEKIGHDLYNLLQTYTDNDTEEEDKNQVKAKIEKLVSTRKDLIDILMIVDPNGVLKLQN
ncbi:hypothetical protein KA013_02220 [Patescibacteria group bacterium]|nr:hypothetical protein [Patescibacteria group bacterium]